MNNPFLPMQQSNPLIPNAPRAKESKRFDEQPSMINTLPELPTLDMPQEDISNPLVQAASPVEPKAKKPRAPKAPKAPTAPKPKQQKVQLIYAATPTGSKRFKSTNPLLVAAKPNRLIPETPGKDPTNLEAVVNVLDLPGSSVRDVLAGENPVDQWSRPTRSENRTSGKELLQQHNLIDNSDSWKNTIAGVGAEILTDPLTFTGLNTLTNGGSALSKAGLLKGSVDNLTEATTKTVRQIIDEAEDARKALADYKLAGGSDAMLDQPIKRVISFAGVDVAKPLAPAIDAGVDALKASAPIRHLRSMFEPRVMNTVRRDAQEIAQHRSMALDDAIVGVGSKFADPVRNNDIGQAKAILSDIAREAQQSGLEMSRFSEYLNADDVSKSLANSEHLTKASAMAGAATELLGTAAKQGNDGVSMLEALKRLGLDTDASKRAISDWSGGGPIDSLRVDEALLTDAGRMIRPFTDPQTAGPVRKAIEDFTRVFKAHVTLPFPAFHFRNMLGGQVQNVLLGANKIHELPDDLATTWTLRNGKTPRGLAESIPEYRQLGLDDETARLKLQDELFAHNVSGDWQMGAADVGKKTANRDAASRMPGANPLLEKTKPTLAQSLNPMDIDNFTPTKIGGDAAGFIEDFNRITGYVGLRKQGFSPDMAAQRVKELQADYSDVTHWESKYGRNVVPFYLFSKKMLGTTGRELASNPGGPMAQTIKATGKQDDSKPHLSRQQASVKIGDNTWSGFGLMHQDAVDAFGALAKGDGKSLSRQLGSKLNPLLKAPLEQAAGADVRTGTPLSKQPPITGSTAVDNLLRNSPMSRYISEAQKLQKDKSRKLLQFGTGLRSE